MSSKAVKKPKEYTATDGTVFTDRKLWKKHEFLTQYTFQNKSGESLAKAAGSIAGQPFDLNELESCEVVLPDHTDQIQIDEIKSRKRCAFLSLEAERLSLAHSRRSRFSFFRAVERERERERER